MAHFIWRILLAVLACVFVFALLPPVCRIIGFSPSEDILLVVHICVAALAILYIVKGPPLPWAS